MHHVVHIYLHLTTPSSGFVAFSGERTLFLLFKLSNEPFLHSLRERLLLVQSPPTASPSMLTFPLPCTRPPFLVSPSCLLCSATDMYYSRPPLALLNPPRSLHLDSSPHGFPNFRGICSRRQSLSVFVLRLCGCLSTCPRLLLEKAGQFEGVTCLGGGCLLFARAPGDDLVLVGDCSPWALSSLRPSPPQRYVVCSRVANQGGGEPRPGRRPRGLDVRGASLMDIAGRVRLVCSHDGETPQVKTVSHSIPRGAGLSVDQ